MDNSHIVLIGGGGHAKVMLDAALCAGIEIKGYVDDDADSPLGAMSGCPAYLGKIDELTKRTLCQPILGVGDLALRARLIEELGDIEFAPPIVHPSASVSSLVSSRSSLALGVFVSAGVMINADAQVCSHAIINTGAIVEHDCRVGVNAHVGPGAVLGGGVRVGNHTLIGIGATVLPGVKIGSRVIVGGGAVVTQDVADGETVVGVPARVVGVGV